MIATAKLTGAEFDALPDEEGRRWELLEGDLIEMPGATARHQKTLGNLFASLREYLLSHPIGDVLPDVEFAMAPNTRLRPDISVLLHDKWHALDIDLSPIPFAPDIAIEIISPSERTIDSTRKVRAYLRYGASEVWQVFPLTAEILVHRSGPTIDVFYDADQLRTPLLPDWQIEVREAVAA